MTWGHASDPPKREPVALVETTGQAWKLSACYGGLIASGILFAVQVLGPREWRMASLFVGLGLGAAGLALLVAIRCPSCRKSLGLWAMTTHTLKTWQDALETVEACPRCGWGERREQPAHASTAGERPDA